jgi:hypothetical protein
MTERHIRIDRVQVIVGDQSVYMELLENMGTIVKDTFSERFASIFWRTYARVMVRYLALDIAAAEARRQFEGNVLRQNLAVVAALAGRAAFDALERADVRMARFLPNRAYVASINIEPGVHDIRINYLSNGRIIQYEIRENIEIRANTLNLIQSVNLGIITEVY